MASIATLKQGGSAGASSASSGPSIPRRVVPRMNRFPPFPLRVFFPFLPSPCPLSAPLSPECDVSPSARRNPGPRLQREGDTPSNPRPAYAFPTMPSPPSFLDHLALAPSSLSAPPIPSPLTTARPSGVSVRGGEGGPPHHLRGRGGVHRSCRCFSSVSHSLPSLR
jgi:hypothetical protein